MRSTCVLFCVLILALFILPGCPGGPSPWIGTWTLTVNNLTRGLQILPDGEASSFELESSLTGTLSWFSHGGQFFLNQDTGTNEIVFIGMLSGDGTAMSGGVVVVAGSGQGFGEAWSAVRN